MDGLDKRRFHAAVKLLYLHLGRQAEESTRYAEHLANESDWSDDVDDAASLGALPTSSVELDELKRAFLDRLAELFSHSFHGPHVAATGLVEQVGRMYVLVAKNNFMEKKSMEMTHYLQEAFRQLTTLDPLSISPRTMMASSDMYTNDEKTLLWKMSEMIFGIEWSNSTARGSLSTLLLCKRVCRLP